VKKCRICKTEYAPFNSLQKVCSPGCAIELVKADQAKAEGCRAKERRKDTRKRREALKTRSDWLREAQTAFNAYIRERDKDENCISCRKQPKKRNAGHYKSVGAYPELRFHPFNCALQCEHCNTYKSGNQVEYRKYLVERIGDRNVEFLEGAQKQQHWTIDDIKEIKQWYKDQLKYLKGEI